MNIKQVEEKLESRIGELRKIQDELEFTDKSVEFAISLHRKVELQDLLEEIKKSHEFFELSGWIMEKHCAMRIIKGSDPERVENRVAFIEKTPRVRLSRYKFGLEEKRDGSGGCINSETDAWIYEPKGSGQEYGEYEPSRQWCDKILLALGWE